MVVAAESAARGRVSDTQGCLSVYARRGLAVSFPHALRLDSFRHLGGTGRHTFPDDVDIQHLGSSQPFLGLHVNALQGSHLPINGGLDDGSTRRGTRIIAD